MFEVLDQKFDMKTDIVTAPVQTPMVIEDMGDDTIDEDVAIARQNIRRVLDVAQDAVSDLANIAKTAESARAFEVLGQLIKTVSETSKDLVELQKTKHDVRKKSGKAPSADGVTNNNVFVGSTNELMQLLQGKGRENI
jgi:hypothetical protein